MGRHHQPRHYAPGARGRVSDRVFAVAAWGVLLTLWTGITATVVWVVAR